LLTGINNSSKYAVVAGVKGGGLTHDTDPIILLYSEAHGLYRLVLNAANNL